MQDKDIKHITISFWQSFVLLLLCVVMLGGQQLHYQDSVDLDEVSEQSDANSSDEEPSTSIEAISFEALVPFAKVQLDLLAYAIFKPTIVTLDFKPYLPNNAPPLPSYFHKTFGHIIVTNAP